MVKIWVFANVCEGEVLITVPFFIFLIQCGLSVRVKPFIPPHQH